MVENLISAISLVVAIFALGISCYLYVVTRRNLVYQVLVNLQMEYRSPEMLYAVSTLWRFYREECREDKKALVINYKGYYCSEQSWVDGFDKLKRIEALKTTLDYQRKLVSHFYHHLATLYANKILSPHIIFATWSEKELNIIPKIIIPMENKLAEILHEYSKEPLPPPLDESSKLYQLYIDSKDYE